MLKTLFLLCVFVIYCEASKEDDEIIDLPGVGFDINFKQYSGYLQVAETRFFHYWFVESQNNSSTDPLVFWFNGGPGCSSIFGFLTEHGPFLVGKKGENLTQNPYAWNTNANVVYIESPAYVGYSYSTKDFHADDDNTATDNYEAIKQFFELFPEYQDRETFVTGESYGGVYVPTLATRIIDGNKDFPINFKGIAIGNGVVSFDIDVETLARFAHYRGAVDVDEWEEAENKCCNGNADTCNITELTGDCQQKYVEFSMSFPNAYDPYLDCMPENYTIPKDLVRYITPNCISDADLATYMNQEQVREALHIHENLTSWAMCNLRPNYKKIYFDVSSFIKKIVESKVRVLLFYGDSDTRCNYLMGEEFSRNLGLKKIEAKTMWGVEIDIPGLTKFAGFKTTYEGLTFATVLGVGHMAAGWAPKRTHNMIQQFINDEPF